MTNKGRPVELKSVAVNRVRPHQMAVAAGDCYVRLYDRRMLSLAQPGAAPPQPLLALAPPHLATGVFNSVSQLSSGPGVLFAVCFGIELHCVRCRRLSPANHLLSGSVATRTLCWQAIADRGLSAVPILPHVVAFVHAGSAPRRTSVPHGTYVQFGSRGDTVIATYHGDHAYSFDVTASEQPPITAFRLPAPDEARCMHRQLWQRCITKRFLLASHRASGWQAVALHLP